MRFKALPDIWWYSLTWHVGTIDLPINHRFQYFEVSSVAVPKLKTGFSNIFLSPKGWLRSGSILIGFHLKIWNKDQRHQCQNCQRLAAFVLFKNSIELICKKCKIQIVKKCQKCQKINFSSNYVTCQKL